MKLAWVLRFKDDKKVASLYSMVFSKVAPPSAEYKLKAYWIAHNGLVVKTRGTYVSSVPEVAMLTQRECDLALRMGYDLTWWCGYAEEYSVQPKVDLVCVCIGAPSRACKVHSQTLETIRSFGD